MDHVTDESPQKPFEPSRARAGGGDTEVQAWEWLEAHCHRNELGDFADRDWSPDEMVDAFMAGVSWAGSERKLAAPARPLCASCDHWQQDNAETGEGRCRINPPQFLPSAETECLGGWWPETEADDWCGQHSDLGGEELPFEPFPRFELASEENGHTLVDRADLSYLNPVRSGESFSVGGWPTRENQQSLTEMQRQLAVEQAAQQLGATPDDMIPGTWHWQGRELTANQLLSVANTLRGVAIQTGGMPFGGQSN